MLSNYRNIMARRDLLTVLVRTELESSVARSRLGWIWWFLDPILMVLIYWGIVSGLFGRGAESYAPYPIFLFTALITWKHFSTVVTRSLSVLRSRERLIKSIPFPTMVLPLSIVFSGFIYFLFGFAVLTAVMLIWPGAYHTGDLLPLLQVPFLMFAQLVVTAGAALSLSCLGALFEDLRLFATHALRVGFYVSPTLFGVDLISDRLAKAAPGFTGEALFAVYMLNPFAVLITGYRDAMMYGRFIPAHWWMILVAESALLFWAGYRTYQYYDRRVIKFL
jgi:ABC-type polysaccharide/polyol phosphate export permease